MNSTWWTRGGRSALVLAMFVAGAGVPAASAKPVPGKPKRSSSSHLFALTFGVMNVNNQYCGINNIGEVCVDPTNSPVVGGGFWPKGTPDQYIFNSGLQLAGTIPPNAGFTWAGDTVGAFFMDPRGDQSEGDPITLVYNSLDPSDQTGANWPTGAYVRDTTIYHPVLVAAATAGLAARDGTGIGLSQEDLWVRNWEGNPAFLSGRTHPMGILVEERGMAWNYPTGNEDIVYFVYTFYNVTASDPAVYANLDPEHQADVAAIGADFQARNEAKFGINIPDQGYTITNMYGAFFEDADVGNASFNYSTAVLPFAMGVAYKSDFLEPLWKFPANIFGSPFVPSPGFTAVKFLRSPLDTVAPDDSTGKRAFLSTFWSNTLNSSTGYPDPVGIKQMYRYISGTSDPAYGDNPCLPATANPKARHYCYQAETPQDTRFFLSAGPFSLAPGQSKSIVVAYIQAAPVGTPTLLAAIGGDFPPQPPEPGDTLAINPAKVRPIENAMGWTTMTDADVNDTITQDEVIKTAVPRSLLKKAGVAQAVYNNRFLLPFSPGAPQFFLVPGDNQVTIVWQKSTTETVRNGGGDPFFAIASDPTSPLYDPNFRQYDVEGYRIYRGRTTGDLALVAQFDYAGTEIVDYTGSFAYTADLNGDGIVQCAPELGVQADCPTTFPSAQGVAHDLSGNVIQVPLGGRTVLLGADTVVAPGDTLHKPGSVLILQADTAVVGGGHGFPALTNTGVGFAFVDKGVRNNFQYYYTVTAFDVNSLVSGPSSLESARITHTVTPRTQTAQEQTGVLSATSYSGRGKALDPSAPLPTLSATTGEFSGPMPPSDGLGAGLTAFLPQLLDTGTIALTVDSVIPGASLEASPATPAVYYLTGKGSGPAVHFSVPVTYDAFSADSAGASPFPATNISTSQSSKYGGDSTYQLYGLASLKVSGTWRLTNQSRGSANGDPANADYNGPRWWTGAANENTPNPTGSNCHPASGACGAADVSLSAGQLAGVDTLFRPASYSTINNAPGRDLEALMSNVARAADFSVYWGNNGHVDSVIDVTHNVPVPFSKVIRASWGILNGLAFTKPDTSITPHVKLNPADTLRTLDTTITQPPAANQTADGKNNLLTWTDMYCVPPVPGALTSRGGADQCQAVAGPGRAMLMDSAILSPIAVKAGSGSRAGSAALTASVDPGFEFYLAGFYFLMNMPSLPAAGTVWHMRSYAGAITGTAATSDLTYTPSIRPPAVPGLQAIVKYSGTKINTTATTSDMLAKVHTVPDPYYVTNALEATANTKHLQFVNLPAQAIIRIYSLSGVLVQVVTHNDPTGGGQANWDLRNRNNQFVASGVYFYHVETPDGKTKVGRFTVVNFAP